jgi:hypothetical protein
MHFNKCKPNLTRIFSFKLSFSLFYYCNYPAFLTTMQIACVAKSSLWTCFVEASIEDMLPTAYVDACTTKFYFRKFFSRPQSLRVAS